MAWTLAAAFYEDPVFRWAFPDDERRRKALPAMFSLFVRAALLVEPADLVDAHAEPQAGRDDRAGARAADVIQSTLTSEAPPKANGRVKRGSPSRQIRRSFEAVVAGCAVDRLAASLVAGEREVGVRPPGRRIPTRSTRRPFRGSSGGRPCRSP